MNPWEVEIEIPEILLVILNPSWESPALSLGSGGQHGIDGQSPD